MLYLTCTTISSVDLAHYGVSCAKDWAFVNCGTILFDILWQVLALSLCRFSLILSII